VDAQGIVVEALVNNAGYGLYGDFEEQPLLKTRKMLELNVVAMTERTRVFAADMVARGSGYILLDAALSYLAGFEAFVLGRVTYEKFAASWSQIHGDPYFDLVNAMPKFVASRTLANLDWNATLVDGDVAEAVAVLKRQPGKNIIKYGTSNLDQTLIRHELIDEFQFLIFPTLVGHGRRLFDGIDISSLALKHTGTKTFQNGIVALTYRATHG
jgi:dihydrofolate reductase